MVKQDIRPIKQELRQKYKQIRRTMDPQMKQKKDNDIFEKVISLKQYQQADMLITFVSTEIEVDTHQLMAHAWSTGKRVVVPRCIDGTRLMDFCEIQSMEDLEPRTFSVLEPKQNCFILNQFPNSFCIVPGLSFDLSGFRLGYGKGYYDRFLNQYDGTTVGICYSSCLHPSLPHGKYDRAVQWLVTEKFKKHLEKSSNK